MAFWKKFYKSRYTGAEIDAAVAAGSQVPEIDIEDAGKILGVDAEGKIVAKTDPVPAVTSADEGKALIVNAEGAIVAGNAAPTAPANVIAYNGLKKISYSGANYVAYTGYVIHALEYPNPNPEFSPGFAIIPNTIIVDLEGTDAANLLLGTGVTISTVATAHVSYNITGYLTSAEAADYKIILKFYNESVYFSGVLNLVDSVSEDVANFVGIIPTASGPTTATGTLTFTFDNQTGNCIIQLGIAFPS